MIKYRPEIDGLRTIAVLAVVIYHAQISLAGSTLLTGGYLGVDIFFVISGYLISSIILRELQSQSFSYLSFYERRARRILPALFAVITASIPFAWELMLPEALKEYAGSVLASLLFSSNIWFFLEDSYTAEPSIFKPFLHTWSLSVEEQFYLFFPVFLLLIWKFAKRHLLKACILGLVLSLTLSEWASRDFINANFYLLPFRIWELSAGVILAVIAQTSVNNESKQSPSHGVLMVIASLMVFVPMVIFDDETRHPSLYTAIPVIGTCMLIHLAGSGDMVTRILSMKPMVLIGKWSYSIYLWHFPIFVFFRLSSFSENSNNIIWLLLIALSILAGSTAYYLIEQPLRNKNRISIKKFSALMVLWFTALTAAFTFIYQSNGVSSRLGSINELLTKNSRVQLSQNHRPCHQRDVESACYFKNSSKEKSKTLVNVGDSHSQSFSVTIKNYADENQMDYLQLTRDACPFSLNVYGFQNKTVGGCNPDTQRKRIDKINLNEKSIIFYSGRYQAYLSAKLYDNKQGGVETGTPTWLSVNRTAEVTPKKVATEVKLTIETLLNEGHTVAIIYPIPEVGWHVPRLLQQKLNAFPEEERLSEFKRLSITTRYDLYKERAAATYDMYDAIAEHPNLVRVYPDKLFCKNATNKCYTHNKSYLYYYDDDHVSQQGARLIFQQAIKKLSAKNLL